MAGGVSGPPAGHDQGHHAPPSVGGTLVRKYRRCLDAPECPALTGARGARRRAPRHRCRHHMRNDGGASGRRRSSAALHAWACETTEERCRAGLPPSVRLPRRRSSEVVPGGPPRAASGRPTPGGARPPDRLSAGARAGRELRPRNAASTFPVPARIMHYRTYRLLTRSCMYRHHVIGSVDAVHHPNVPACHSARARC